MDEEALFNNYVHICSRALNTNKGRFPFNKIFEATQKVCEDSRASMVRVVNDLPEPCFEIKINRDGISGRKISECGKEWSGCKSSHCNKHVWNVHASYLKDVVSNPDYYINNPAMLNWEWVISEED